MWFRQIYGGSTPPECFTDVVPSNILEVYTPKIFHGCGSVKNLGAVHPQSIRRMWFRPIFGGSTPPKYLTDGVPSNIWGVYIPKVFDGCGSVKYFGLYTPKVFDGWGSVKYLGGLRPENISRMWFRQIFGGSTPSKYFRDLVPSNIWGVYTPKKFHGWGSVKYSGGLHPQNISRMGFRQIFGGRRPPEYFMDGVPSNIWGP